MEIVKAFTSNSLHTEIIIKGTVWDPLFRASDIGLVLEMANVRQSILNFDCTEKVVSLADTLGGEQSVTFLTEKGLYKLLFRSRKPIANQFQNWICDVVKEIRLTGKYDIEEKDKKLKELENKNLELEEKIKVKYTKEREQMLLAEFGCSGSIVYIIRVKSLDQSRYIIKIGESRKGILHRFNEHRSKYEDILLLDCYKVKRCKDFESFIHNHEEIRLNRVTDLHDHEKERELFLIGSTLSYQRLSQIIESNVCQFDEVNEACYNALQDFNDKLIEQLSCRRHTCKRVEQTSEQSYAKQSIENLEKSNREILEKISTLTVKSSTNFNQPLVTLGPRLQKINPETLTLIRVFEYVNECLKESNFEMKRPSIMKAIKERTVYHGFRWALVDRSDDATIIGDIGATKVVTPKTTGYIAKMNQEKTEILNVYLDRKTAALENGYTSSALDNPVLNCTFTRGHHYSTYVKLSDTLRNDFELKHGTPFLFKDGVGQFDEKGKLLQEFSCKFDCMKGMTFSDKTLRKALDSGLPYNRFCYRSIGGRIVWI